MLVSRFALGAAFALALSSTAQAQVADFDSAAAQTLFDEYAAQFPALNATVMRHGEIIWEAEGGTQRSDRDSVSLDYNFYSIAKMLTGMAYARLEHEAGLDLDRGVRTIDPSLPEAYHAVTLRQLLSHAGGIRHYNSDRDWQNFSERRCETPADAIGHFIDDRLASTPGAEHEYTTYGFTLLSHLLVILTETDSFDAAMSAALGEHYLAQTDADDADKATNYVQTRGRYEVRDDLNAQCKFGGGGLLASARDLAAMGTAFATGEIVPLDQMADLTSPYVTSDGEETNYVYGMGAGFAESLQSHYGLHSGGSPGGRAYLAVFVEHGISVGMTANFDGPALPDAAIGLGRLAAGHALETDD